MHAVVWAYGRGQTDIDRQTDTQTRVTTIHFASSTTHAKCNKYVTCKFADEWPKVGINERCYFGPVWVRYIVMSLSVCLSVCPLAYLRSPMLPVAVARSSSDDNAMRYVLPVWSMTSYNGNYETVSLNACQRASI